MRKKFLAMYALAGALVASPIFTSCIDDTESESVTAVRKEAAEKLRIANEIAQATKDLQIQSDKAYYEQNIANYQAKLLEYQLNLKKNQDALDAYGIKNLSELTSAYTTALSNAATSEFNLATYNRSMKQLEAGYTDAQAYIAEETERLNTLIAANEATIEELKKYEEEGLSTDAINAKQTELYNAYAVLNKEYTDLVFKYGEEAANTVTGKAIAYLDELSGYGVYGRSTDGDEPTGDDTTGDDNGTTGDDTTGDDNGTTGDDTTGDDNGTTGDDSYTEPTVHYYQWNAEGNPVLVESAVLNKQKKLAGNINDVENIIAVYVAALGTEADTEETTVSEESTELTLYAQLAAANKTLAAAEKAVADAGEAVTDDLEQAVTEAETVVEEAELAIAQKKDDIVSYESSLAYYKNESEKFEAAIAAFSGEDYETYLAAVAELEAADDAKNLAWLEYYTWDQTYQYFNEPGVYNSDNGYQESMSAALQRLTSQIDDYRNAIGNLAPYYYNYTAIDSDEMYAAAVAHLEKQIAAEEANLASYNKQAEEAKAALDAYLGTSDDTATEEA